MASIAAVIDSDVVIPDDGAERCSLLVMTRFKSAYWLCYAHSPGDVKTLSKPLERLSLSGYYG
ncbi:MAG TPA: hypothetical protein V6C95_16275 [Coleofasciculaceae cyanobacterium]